EPRSSGARRLRGGRAWRDSERRAPPARSGRPADEREISASSLRPVERFVAQSETEAHHRFRSIRSVGVACVQDAPVLLDGASGTVRIIDWIARAAGAKARLVAFGEAFLPRVPALEAVKSFLRGSRSSMSTYRIAAAPGRRIGAHSGCPARTTA